MKLSIICTLIMVSLSYMNSDRVNVTEEYTMVNNSTDIFPTASATWYYKMWVHYADAYCQSIGYDYSVACDLPGSECSSPYSGGCFYYN